MIRLVLILSLASSLAAQDFSIARRPPPATPPASGPTFVNGGGDFTGGGTMTVGWNMTVGNTMIVWTYANGTSITNTCSDSKGNTYTPDGSVLRSAGGASVAGRIFHSPITTGGTGNVITCTGTTPAVTAIEITGTRVLDTAAVGSIPSTVTGCSSPCTPTAFTTTTAATALINGFASTTSATVTITQVDGLFTTSASGVLGATQFVGAIGYRIVSSTASYSDGWTIVGGNSDNVALLAAYK